MERRPGHHGNRAQAEDIRSNSLESSLKGKE